MRKLNEIKKSKVSITVTVEQAQILHFALYNVLNKTNGQTKLTESVSKDKYILETAINKLYYATNNAYQNQ
jgi:hypothetical protein